MGDPGHRQRGTAWALAFAVVLGGCRREMPSAPPLASALRDGVTQAESLAVQRQHESATGRPSFSTESAGTCTIAWSAPDTVAGCNAPVPTAAPAVPWLVHDGEALGPDEIEQRDSIHIGFGVPVQGLTLASTGALNCSGTLGTLVGYRHDTLVAQADNALTDPADCGSDDVTFGVTGQFPLDSVIDSLVILGVNPWTFPVFNLTGRAWLKYTLTYQPVSQRCQVPVTAYSQGDPQWGDVTYDSTGKTIRVKGCALTALAMSLTWAGHPVTPSSLNTFMNDHDDFQRGGGVVWVGSVPDFSGQLLQWKNLEWTEDRVTLAQTVCTGTPVIVQVPSQVHQRGSHFVLVTGAPRTATDTTSLDQFKIVDPDGFRYTSLAAYGSFELRGYPEQAGITNVSSIQTVASTQLDAVDAPASRLELYVAGGALLVTDPDGRRLGQAASDGPIINEIPGGIYYPDNEPDEHTGEVGPYPQSPVAIVPDPIGGVYGAQVIATMASAGEVRAIVVSRAATQRAKFPLPLTAGQVARLVITYDTSSGGPPLIQPAVSAWAANRAYAVGDSASYNHLDYVCRQAHTSQVGWEPPNVYALWARVAAGATWTPQVMYGVGDEVVYQGVRYRAIQTHQSQPGWEPPNVPALWTRVQ